MSQQASDILKYSVIRKKDKQETKRVGTRLAATARTEPQIGLLTEDAIDMSVWLSLLEDRQAPRPSDVAHKKLDL